MPKNHGRELSTLDRDLKAAITAFQTMHKKHFFISRQYFYMDHLVRLKALQDRLLHIQSESADLPSFSETEQKTIAVVMNKAEDYIKDLKILTLGEEKPALLGLSRTTLYDSIIIFEQQNPSEEVKRTLLRTLNTLNTLAPTLNSIITQRWAEKLEKEAEALQRTLSRAQSQSRNSATSPSRSYTFWENGLQSFRTRSQHQEAGAGAAVV
jgi:hypothetical protein